MSPAAAVAGIDIGTGGVRVVACDARGTVLAAAEQPLTSQRAGAQFEQAPEEWWAATAACLRQVTAELRGRAEIAGVGVAGTSGTLCLLDDAGRALRPALMYSDARAEAEAAELAVLQGRDGAPVWPGVHSSWALPKLLWLTRNEPAAVAGARHVAHAGDVINGRLCGEYGVSDWTQALKTGYDVSAERWPPEIEAALGLPAVKLPRVVPSGQIIGRVGAVAAEATGLPRTAAVVSGMTDGCAAQIATGATRPGQWLSVLGTTLVLKGVGTQPLHDPEGRIYCHRHPSGYWLPGAASNVGGAALEAWPRAELAGLDRRADVLAPTGLVCYPLRRQGERFPFVSSTATAFMLGSARSDAERYAATLEGVAYVERLCYDVVSGLGAHLAPTILTTGGGARSVAWLGIRADILERELAVAEASGAAFGAAVLAAAATLHGDLDTAAAAMARSARLIQPRAGRAAAYREGYERFLGACRERGYLKPLTPQPPLPAAGEGELALQ